MDFTTRHRLMLDDGPVVYRKAADGKPPLVLIHGWGGSSGHWQYTPAHLSDVRDLSALDLSGHGETPVRSAATGPESLARLVIDFADGLGLDRFELNGHSWGAAVAILVAAHWPDRVDRLVLTSLGTARNALERLALTQAHHQMSLAMALWRPWLEMSRPWLVLSRPAIEWFGARQLVYRAIAGHVLRRLPADDAMVRVEVQAFLSTDPHCRRSTFLRSPETAPAPAPATKALLLEPSHGSTPAGRVGGHDASSIGAIRARSRRRPDYRPEHDSVRPIWRYTALGRRDRSRRRGFRHRARASPRRCSP